MRVGAGAQPNCLWTPLAVYLTCTRSTRLRCRLLPRSLDMTAKMFLPPCVARHSCAPHCRNRNETPHGSQDALAALHRPARHLFCAEEPSPSLLARPRLHAQAEEIVRNREAYLGEGSLLSCVEHAGTISRRARRACVLTKARERADRTAFAMARAARYRQWGVL